MLDFSKQLTESEPLIHPSCVVNNCQFGQYVELGDHCIAADSYVGSYTYLFGGNDIYNCSIGKFNSIATGVRINPVQHPMRERAAAHHFTYRAAHYGLGENDEELIAWRKNLTVTTGHDVWIGHNAIIMGGVRLGNGAVVAAGAVVTHDVAPYEIVAGVPARHIGWRYDEATIAAMEEIAWWDWDHETLKARLKDFNDVAQFVATYAKSK